MSRVWTGHEQDTARAIATILGTAPAFTGSYALGVHAAVGGAGHSAIKSRVEAVMPLVAEMVVQHYPGQRLLIDRRHGGPAVYSLVPDTNAALNRQAVTRARAATTKMRRVEFEFAEGTPTGHLANVTAHAVSEILAGAAIVFQAAQDEAAHDEPVEYQTP